MHRLWVMFIAIARPGRALTALRCSTRAGRIKATMIDFEVGVLLPAAVESSGTNALVSE